MQSETLQPTMDELLRRLRFPGRLERAFRAEYFRKSLDMARLVLALTFAILLLVGLLDVSSSGHVPTRLWLLYYGVDCGGVLFALCFSFSRRFARYMQFAIGCALLGVGMNLILINLWYPSITNDAIDLSPINVIMLIMGVYTVSTLRFLPAVMVCWPLVGLYEFTAWRLGISRIPDFTGDNINLLMANVFGMVASHSRERYIRRDFLLTRGIRAERRKSERLLLNVLPPSIARRLKQKPAIIADHFTEVTVLFADIVEFTPIAASISPAQIVQLLNDIFSCFDALAEKHGLEKIKTIGDAYMVVGGLPEPKTNHACAVAAMALDMQAEIARFNPNIEQPLQLRIGIHTGPVVAGVIGRQKFSYDLWGDTVNLASRMESHCPIGKIQITEETYALLQQNYTCVEQGEISVKGRGVMVTYLLKSKRSPSPLISVSGACVETPASLESPAET